jgi:hypothetical protein
MLHSNVTTLGTSQLGVRFQRLPRSGDSLNRLPEELESVGRNPAKRIGVFYSSRCTANASESEELHYPSTPSLNVLFIYWVFARVLLIEVEESNVLPRFSGLHAQVGLGRVVRVDTLEPLNV